MDHPCEKCGALVEDGRPFCPQCRAPQIHVQYVTPAGDAAALVDETVDQPPAGIPQLSNFDRATTLQPGLFDRRVAVRSALKAGFIGTFLGLIPVLGIVLTGSLAVLFYRREKGSAPATSTGARLGAAAGVVVFTVNALFIIPVIVLHLQQQFVDRFSETAQKFGFNTATPEFQAGIRNLFTPSGLVTSFFFALILAAVGGALAAMIFRPSSRP